LFLEKIEYETLQGGLQEKSFSQEVQMLACS